MPNQTSSVKQELSRVPSATTMIALVGLIITMGGLLIRANDVVNGLQLQIKGNTDAISHIVNKLAAMEETQNDSQPTFAVLQRRVEVMEQIDTAQNNRLDHHHDEINNLRRMFEVLSERVGIRRPGSTVE